jgi:hypothetical protein
MEATSDDGDDCGIQERFIQAKKKKKKEIYDRLV